MERFFEYARVQASGAPAPGATITVYDQGTLNLATIFADNLGTPKANPFVADANAYLFFYAANGRYDVELSGVGAGIPAPYTWGDVVLSDFVSFNGLTAPNQLFAVGSAGNDFAIVSAVATHTFNIPSASATARGLVTTGAQTFAGAKTFSTPIAPGSGGTGLNASAAANGQLLIGNGTGFSLGALGGTANQISVAAGAGTITLATPQNIDTGAAVTFGSLTLSGLTASAPVVTSGAKLLASAPLTNGQLLIGSTGAAPVAATITAGTGIAVTNGAGSITIAATTVGITSLNGSTAAVQTFGTGTSGTDFAIVTNTGAGSHTFNIPDAGSSARGLVTTGTQSFAGQKQFDLTPQYKPGGDSAYDATVSGFLAGSVDTTQRANSGAGETTLSSYSLPASVLNTNGKAIRISAWGTFAANANNKAVKIKFGATSFLATSNTHNNQSWYASLIIIRTGAATQKGIVYGLVGGNQVQPVSAAAAETLSGAVTIVTTGQATSNNDILQEGFFIEVIGA